MANVVGERFQITIDKKARHQLGIHPGDIAIERVQNGRLVVTFVPKPHRESQLGILKRYVADPIEPITDWDAWSESVWSRRTDEIAEVLRRDSEKHCHDPSELGG